MFSLFIINENNFFIILYYLINFNHLTSVKNKIIKLLLIIVFARVSTIFQSNK